MLNLNGLDPYKSCICPLSVTSIGGDYGEALTDIDVESYNFDEMMKEYIKINGIHHTFLKESCDALFIARSSDRKICLIEFKSGNIGKDLNNLKSKAYSSLLILTDVLNTTISTTRICIHLFLVYDKEKNPLSKKEAIISDSAAKSNNRFVRFGLYKFEGLYFKEVHTVDKRDFSEYFRKHWLSE